MDWFRFYNGAIHDAKIIKLSDEMFRAWVTILCLASRNDGVLPSTGDIAAELRVKPTKVAAWIAALSACCLLDKRDDGAFVPHNWNGRQYKTDGGDPTNAARQKRYRDKHRNDNNAVTRNDDSNGSNDVTAKRPDTDTDTEQIQNRAVADATGADAPNPRDRLFKEGLSKLASLTGKGPDACRSFVGKCLKAAEDDAIVVLGLIEDAERNQVANPSAWIAARLKGNSNGNSGSKVIQAIDDLRGKIASFDGPNEIRSGQSQAPPRLLSNR